MRMNVKECPSLPPDSGSLEGLDNNLATLHPAPLSLWEQDEKRNHDTRRPCPRDAFSAALSEDSKYGQQVQLCLAEGGGRVAPRPTPLESVPRGPVTC